MPTNLVEVRPEAKDFVTPYISIIKVCARAQRKRILQGTRDRHPVRIADTLNAIETTGKL
jgi:hypothetical protein